MYGPLSELKGELEERQILDVLRELHFRRRTGVLEVDSNENKRRLFLRDGSLYLAGTHPLARRLAETVQALSDGSNRTAAAEARKRCLDLVERMARVIKEWRSGQFRFVEGLASIGGELVGPLPTRRLLMIGATVGATPGELTTLLGGERLHLILVPDTSETQESDDLLGLGPEEQFLLERLRQPMKLGATIEESPFDRETTLQRLAQLLAARKIRVVERADPALRDAPLHDAALLASLSERFERNLKEEPLELSQEEFKARVAELFAGIGAMNFYELLNVDPTSPIDVVQSKYEALARQVHPANEAAYGLTGLKAMLALLFERATQGYLVLSNPDRRHKYNQGQVIDLTASRVTGEKREVESKELARRYFDQAQALVARGDFHYAIEMLQTASKLDRRSEYLLALARAEVKNPKWVQRAIDTCRAALEVDPHNAEVRYLLGEIFEEQGDLERARSQYSAAVRADPGHVQAVLKMRNLVVPKGQRQESDNGLFGRIFRRRDG